MRAAWPGLQIDWTADEISRYDSAPVRPAHKENDL
jgi:hypothetical protein